MKRRITNIAATLIATAIVGSSSAFIAPSHQGRIITRPQHQPLFSSSSGSGEGYQEGEALAKEFYDLVRSKESSETVESGADPNDGKEAEKEEYRRLLGYEQQQENADNNDESSPPSPSPLSPEEEANIRSRDAFATRREVRVSKDGVATTASSSSSSGRKKSKKFTGAAQNMSPPLDSTGTPSAGLFSGRGGSVFSYPDGGSSSAVSQQANGGPSDARSRMMQREFNLVSWAGGAGQYALAALLAFSLVTVVYVGATGGITDGSDRFVEASEFNVLGDFTVEGNGITPEDWNNVGVPPKMEGISVWL